MKGKKEEKKEKKGNEMKGGTKEKPNMNWRVKKVG